MTQRRCRRVKVLENWDVLSEALLDDKACEKRGETATTDVALLLQAAAQKACGVEIGLSSTARRFFFVRAQKGTQRSVQRAGSATSSSRETVARRKVLRVKAAAAIEEHRHQLTMVMSRTLLKLLRKFQADAVKVSLQPALDPSARVQRLADAVEGVPEGCLPQAAALASVVQHLKLEIFSLKKEEQGLEGILRAIVTLLTKHATPDTTQACVQALAHCADPEGGGPQARRCGATRVLPTGRSPFAVETAAAVCSVPQEPGHGILVQLAAALVEKLAGAARELLALSEEELAAEAAAERGGECEEVFNCRIALLRVHQLLLVSPAACRSAGLAHSLGSLIEVSVGTTGTRVAGLRLAARQPAPRTEGRLVTGVAPEQAALEGPLPACLLEDAVKCRALLLAWQLQQQLECAGGNFEGWPSAAAEFIQNLHRLLEKEGVPRAAVVFCMADMFEIFRPENTEVSSLRERALSSAAGDRQEGGGKEGGL